MTFFLDQATRAKVRHYLGYPGLAIRYMIDTGIPQANETALVLEEHMRNVLDQESLDIIIDIVCKLDKSRCRIEDAGDRLKLSAIDDIKYNHDEIASLWREDDRLVRQLSITMNVPPYQIASQGYRTGNISIT